MILQDQLTWDNVTDENLRFFRQIGIDNLVVGAPPTIYDGRDRSSEFLRMREFIESYGMRFYVIQMEERCWDEITLGLPGRDKKIEHWCTALRGMGKAGIPVLGYVFNAIGHFRTKSSTGRGGAIYDRFDYKEHMQNPPVRAEKQIGEETLWENFAYFLERVIPVAEESGVRMALHPDDPPIPEPLGGAARIMCSFDNFKRAIEIVPSPHNGLEFCQGCFAEMGCNVLEAVKYFATQEKMFYVHFRNIRGKPHSFEEVFIDEGDMNMLKAMQTYKEAGFNGPFMMDHTPVLINDPGSRVGRAYAAGYIRSLIQVVYG